jgi:CsoR family transcriptional regulator, copper-sensing transcriptional repressor
MTTPERTHDHVEYWYAENKPALLGRLRRIEGQVRGVHRMVDEDTYCIDVLTQIAATTKALQAVAVGLLEGHLAHCVVDAAREDADPTAKVKEATDAVARLMRV